MKRRADQPKDQNKVSMDAGSSRCLYDLSTPPWFSRYYHRRVSVRQTRCSAQLWDPCCTVWLQRKSLQANAGAIRFLLASKLLLQRFIEVLISTVRTVHSLKTKFHVNINNFPAVWSNDTIDSSVDPGKTSCCTTIANGDPGKLNFHFYQPPQRHIQGSLFSNEHQKFKFCCTSSTNMAHTSTLATLFSRGATPRLA